MVVVSVSRLVRVRWCWVGVVIVDVFFGGVGGCRGMLIRGGW